MKKIPCIFLIYCLTCSGSLLAQTTQLKIKLDILPSLKTLLKDTKCDISIINLETRIQKTFNDSGPVIFDSIPIRCLAVQIGAFVKVGLFQKNYTLFASFNLRNDSVNEVVLQFPMDCSYNTNGLNSICPKCKKGDNVHPVIYGLFMPSSEAEADKMCVYYLGGCEITNCDPSWFCGRDKLFF